MSTMNASDFKARCLAVLDEVARTGEPVTILKRGKPVARLVSPTTTVAESSQASLLGSVTILGDIDSPVIEPTEWNAVRGQV